MTAPQQFPGDIEVGGEVHAKHVLADGDKANGAPAANFGSHVGIDGDLHCSGTGNFGPHIVVKGDKASGNPAANFGGHVGMDGDLHCSGTGNFTRVVVSGDKANNVAAAEFGSNINVTGDVGVTGDIGMTGDIVCFGKMSTAHLQGIGNITTGEPAANFGSHVGVDGDLHVEGNIDVGEHGDVRLFGADCAENFDVARDVTVISGSVMVLNDDGELEPCSRPYDSRVIGVVSGAGTYRPGVILDNNSSGNRHCAPIGLIGKVFCMAEASSAPIEVGDLLTTSPIAGHAMKATGSNFTPGAIIGKALRTLADGRGLIPMLVIRQ